MHFHSIHPYLSYILQFSTTLESSWLASFNYLSLRVVSVDLARINLQWRTDWKERYICQDPLHVHRVVCSWRDAIWRRQCGKTTRKPVVHQIPWYHLAYTIQVVESKRLVFCAILTHILYMSTSNLISA